MKAQIAECLTVSLHSREQKRLRICDKQNSNFVSFFEFPGTFVSSNLRQGKCFQHSLLLAMGGNLFRVHVLRLALGESNTAGDAHCYLPSLNSRPVTQIVEPRTKNGLTLCPQLIKLSFAFCQH